MRLPANVKCFVFIKKTSFASSRAVRDRKILLFVVCVGSVTCAVFVTQDQLISVVAHKRRVGVTFNGMF